MVEAIFIGLMVGLFAAIVVTAVLRERERRGR